MHITDSHTHFIYNLVFKLHINSHINVTKQALIIYQDVFLVTFINNESIYKYSSSASYHLPWFLYTDAKLVIDCIVLGSSPPNTFFCDGNSCK